MSLERLVITTGGTCGHIFPALAVAAEARRQHPDCQVLFLGGSGPEGTFAAEAGVDFICLPARGVMGKGARGLISSTWVVSGIWKAARILSRFKPQVVVGFGGYAGFCPVLAAWLKGIPTTVHEQNAVPGATNRILARLVRRIFLSFPDTASAFAPEKCHLVGNPVRSEIFQAFKSERGHRRLLVLGGSQGALAVNTAVIEALPVLRKLDVEILHQTGTADEGRVKEAYQAAGWDADSVVGFIKDMTEAYAWADLALCRSGASTVFEVAAAGLPAIFVPFPHATHDHQRVNAKAMEATGGAMVLDQIGLDGEQVALTLRTLFDNPLKLNRMAESAHAFARPDAALSIVDAITSLIRPGVAQTA